MASGAKTRKPQGISTRGLLSRIVVVVVVLHGLIHLLGAAKGFGWADVSQLTRPIGPVMATAWLTAAVLVVAAGLMLAGRVRDWWLVSVLAAVVSQAVISTAWHDAKVGTVANVILLGAAVYGYAAHGPSSHRVKFERLVDSALAESPPHTVVSEADLVSLPPAVAAYVRQSGAVGQPRVSNFRARVHGRIRASSEAAWMTFTAEQVNTYGPEPARFFLMDAALFGLPVDVLHVYLGPAASMRVRLCSLVPMVDMTGPVMDRSETVTLFNDLCLLAPAALVDAPVIWQSIDVDRVRGTFSNAGHTVTAELTFNQDHELVDFVSDDRSRATRGGKGSVRQRWSTPVADYRQHGCRRLCTYGEGRWHAPEPEGTFSYIEFTVDDISYNVRDVIHQSSAAMHAVGEVQVL